MNVPPIPTYHMKRVESYNSERVNFPLQGGVGVLVYLFLNSPSEVAGASQSTAGNDLNFKLMIRNFIYL